MRTASQPNTRPRASTTFGAARRKGAPHANPCSEQLQGRRGQDDYCREPGRDIRGARPAHAAHRPGPPGIRNRLLRVVRPRSEGGQDLHPAALRQRRRGGRRLQDRGREPLRRAVHHRAHRPERAHAARAAPALRARRLRGGLRRRHHRLQPHHEAPGVQRLPGSGGLRHGDHPREARLHRHARHRAHRQRHPGHRRRPARAGARLQDPAHLRARPHDQRREDRRGGAGALLRR